MRNSCYRWYRWYAMRVQASVVRTSEEILNMLGHKLFCHIGETRKMQLVSYRYGSGRPVAMFAQN